MTRSIQIVLLTLVWCASSLSPAFAQKPVIRSMDDQSFVALNKERGAHLDVRVEKAKQLIPALKVYTGRHGDNAFAGKKHGVVFVSKTRALIPYFELSPLMKKVFLSKLWPKDRLVKGHWQHRVSYPGLETLWSVSQWFTGTGQHYRAIIKASGLRSDRIGKGVLLKIPQSLLLPFLGDKPTIELPKLKEPQFQFQTNLEEGGAISEGADRPMVTAPSGQQNDKKAQPRLNSKAVKVTASQPAKAQLPTKGKGGDQILQQLDDLAESRKELRWGKDRKGRYAAYRLKSGEAIYSSVVVRFCGLVRGEDVNRVASLIIQRNGIRDETDLAIGTEIRIPYEHLEPEFRAADDAEFQAFVKNVEEVSLVATEVDSRNLEGVHILLDPGHGGRDPGANIGGVWEDDYVYDIICRVKFRLERESAAKVFMTLIDPSVKYKVQNVRKFIRDSDEKLLTNPRYPLTAARSTVDGVNLRWVLANHHYKNWKAKGIKPENMIFASFHADSLHRSIRGSMVYIPDAREYPKRVVPSRRFKNYREYKSSHFSFSKNEMKKAQARSMSFALNYVNRSRQSGILVHKQKPIRSIIRRNKRFSYVPAVLKYNRIPTRCLIEVCNLNNAKDRKLISDPQFRQRVADTFVETIYQTYGVSPRLASKQRASIRSAVGNPSR